MFVSRYVEHVSVCVQGTCFSHVHVRGQRPVLSAFPNAPASRTESWWNHRKLDCLPFALEAAWKRHSLSSQPHPTTLLQYLQLAAIATPPPSSSSSLVHPCSHPIMEACRTEPLLLHVIQSFSLRCRNAGLDVSRVLNKAAACTIPAAAEETQHCVVYHPNGVEQYA